MKARYELFQITSQFQTHTQFPPYWITKCNSLKNVLCWPKKIPLHSQTEGWGLKSSSRVFILLQLSPLTKNSLFSDVLTCSWPGIRDIHQWPCGLWHGLVMNRVGDSQGLLLGRLSKVGISEQNRGSVVCKWKNNQTVSTERWLCLRESFAASPQVSSAQWHHEQRWLPALCRAEVALKGGSLWV